MPNTINQPGGSASSSLNPPEADPLWEVVGDWHWELLPAHTFSDGVGQAFDRGSGGPPASINFVSRNTANAGTLAVNSSGLEIGMTSSESSNRYYHTTQTGPIVFATLSDIVTGYSLQDTVVIQCVMDPVVDTVQGSNASAQHVYGGLMVFDGGYGASGGGNWYQANWYRQLSAANNYYHARYGGGTAAGAGDNVVTADTGGGAPTFCELVIYPGTGWSCAMSLDTSIQPPMTVSTGVYYGNMETSLPQDIGSGGTISPGTTPDFTLRPANISVGMWGSYLTTAGSRASEVTVTFKRFRVLRRRS
jgi:hypothetical protein